MLSDLRIEKEDLLRITYEEIEILIAYYNSARITQFFKKISSEFL